MRRQSDALSPQVIECVVLRYNDNENRQIGGQARRKWLHDKSLRPIHSENALYRGNAHFL